MFILNEYLIYSKYLERQPCANSEDFNQTASKAAVDQGLHYLPFHHKFQSEITWAQLFKTNNVVSQQKYLGPVVQS